MCGLDFFRTGLAATFDCRLSSADSVPRESVGGSIANASRTREASAWLVGTSPVRGEAARLVSPATGLADTIGVIVSNTTPSGHLRSEWMRMIGGYAAGR